MKIMRMIFATVVIAAAVSYSAYAATDCIYSAEYTYDSGFEGAEYDSNCGWIPYHNTTTATAELVTSETAGEKAVFEGKRAIRFSNMPNQGGGRGIYFKTGYSGQTEWTFNKGDTVELSGMFRTDAGKGAQIWFSADSAAFPVQEIKTVGDEWVYISGRYTFGEDRTSNFRINTDIDTNSGYIYADNISIKRVLYTGEKAAVVRADVKNGVYAAIDGEGNLYMWGKGTHGVLNPENTEVARPKLKMTEVSDIALGDGHAVVLKTDGSVMSWGRNDCGQLGDGTLTDRAYPACVATGMKLVAAGYAHTVIVDKVGCAYGAGMNTTCQFMGGGQAYHTSFDKINVNFYVHSAWASGMHTFLKSSGGYIYGIGYNGNAQLGNGSFLPQLSYAKLSEKRLLDIDTTNSCTVCLGYDRKLYAAGFARHGQFGSADAYETLTEICDNADTCSVGEASMLRLSGGEATVLGSESGGLEGDGSTPSVTLTEAVSGVADTDVLYLRSDGELCNMEGVVLGETAEPDPEPIDIPGLVFDLDGGIAYNPGSGTVGGTLILAAYDDNGRFINVSIAENISNEKISISPFDCDAADYKLMVWSNLLKMRPLEDEYKIDFAGISAEGSQYGDLWQLTVRGTATAIDGVRQGKTKVTLVAYDKTQTNDISGIRAMEQVTTAEDGTFECSIPMRCKPSDCVLRVGISGEVLEKNIGN